MKIKIYGVRVLSHPSEIEVADDATDEQIHKEVYESLAECLDFGWEKVSE